MLSVILIAATATRPSEVWNQEQTEAAGIVWRGNYTDGTPQPYEYVANEDCNTDTVYRKMCRRSGELASIRHLERGQAVTSS